MTAFYDTLVAQYGSIPKLTVRQLANMLIDLSEDNTDLSNNLLLRMLFKPDILDTHNHTAALPAYFDVS